MNNCVLMAKVVKSPELRYTAESQLAVANMLVEFEGISPNDSPNTVKVVGWGNLATEINETYKEGDEVIMEGRLAMNTFDRPEGFKEKRAEFIVSRIFGINSSASFSAQNTSTGNTSANANNVIPFQSNPSVSPKSQGISDDYEENPSPSPDSDLDDIPF
jgi:single-strand DNA-binding protein